VFFKDSPPPAPIGFYTEAPKKAAWNCHGGKRNFGRKGFMFRKFNNNNNDESQTQTQAHQGRNHCHRRHFLKNAVPRALELFFPDGKILPYNLPEFLSSAVQVKIVPNSNDIDLDVNIPLLKDILFRQGLTMLDEKRYEEGLKAFEGVSILNGGTSPLAHYNIACAQSLMGRLDIAVDSLKEAVSWGYRNLQHMLSDSDLNAIRALPGYLEVVTQLKECGKIEEKVKDEKKEEEKKEEIKEEVKEEIKEEIKEVEVIKEEVKIEEPAPSENEVKFKTELQLLVDMGFTDGEKNLSLLLAESGDLANVIHHLFA